jgi:hypothetical protein
VSTDPTPWPDTALVEQAPSIGPAILQLIDSDTRWVHRRAERIELVNATQVTRSVATDLTVPVALESMLGLYPAEPERRKGGATRFVLPLGILPKGPLQDVSLSPTDVHRLSADQANPLLVAALVPYATRSGAPANELLKLARRIIRSERPSPDLLERFKGLLESAQGGEAPARERLASLVQTLDRGYVLLAAVKANAGMPMRVTYTHRQVVETYTGEVDDPPLVVESALPYASGLGSAYRVEVVAPEGLEIETASIVAVEGRTRRPVESVNTDPGGGAFVHLRAPDAGDRPAEAGMQVTFGWPAGGIHHIATIAGAASTAALLTATLVSYWLDENMRGSSASTLLAAPALVSGLALGFATTRVTSKAVNRLRVAAFCVALIGIAGALSVSLLGENAAKVNTRHGWLIGCTVLSALVTAGFPLRAALRERAAVPLQDKP